MRKSIVLTTTMLAVSACADVDGTKVRAIQEAKMQCETHGKVFIFKNVEVTGDRDVAVRGYCAKPGEQIPPDIMENGGGDSSR